MKDCENCENGIVFKWHMTRHGYDTKAQRCEECDGTGKVEDDDWTGDDPYRPTRGGMPSEHELDVARRMK